MQQPLKPSTELPELMRSRYVASAYFFVSLLITLSLRPATADEHASTFVARLVLSIDSAGEPFPPASRCDHLGRSQSANNCRHSGRRG